MPISSCSYFAAAGRMSLVTHYTRPKLVQQALDLLACEVHEADALASPEVVRDYVRPLLASIIDTCRLRNASVTDFLAKAIHAARLGLPAPELPPIPAHLLGRHGALVGM